VTTCSSPSLPSPTSRISRTAAWRIAEALPGRGRRKDARFWKLADNLVKFYPPGTDERRWVEGVLARKKGLGL